MGITSGSGPRSYFREVRNHVSGGKILKFFDADPGWKKFGSGIRDGKNSDRDPGWKKIGSGINIPDPQHCKKIIFLLL
jgi:hypothetical protein